MNFIKITLKYPARLQDILISKMSNTGKSIITSPFQKRFAGLALLFLLSLLMFFPTSSANAQNREGFKVINPYENKKDFPYKASLHNHTHFHPEYAHATEPAEKRLKDYRDYNTNPPYGIVSISDHSRVSTPWNTTPNVMKKDGKDPWGIGGILWIPGNESSIGSSHNGGVVGDLLITNVSIEPTNNLHWSITQDPSARSGWLYTSVEMPASVELSFKGVGFNWIARTEPGGGIAKVYLNNAEVGEANLFSSEVEYNQNVFSLKGLKNKKHTVRMVYDRKGESDSRYMAKINVDLILVLKANGNKTEYGAQHPELSYQPYQYKHAMHPREVEEGFKMLSEDGCFLTLAHPNSRLVTEGEHKGTQLWTSSGYTFDELDIMFGNKEKGIPPLTHQPHALEIGNRGYDFSERTAYKNAEEKWDYLLMQGHRIMGIASDDTHGSIPFEGWITVYTNAETRKQLTIEDVMESMFAGNFYASQGPNMEIEINDNLFTIQTEQPSLIEFISDGKVIHQVANSMSASYIITGNETYVRGRVTRDDKAWREIQGGIGKRRSAWTNPVYIIP